MKKSTEKIFQILNQEYGVDKKLLNLIEDSEQDHDIIKVGNNTYIVYNGIDIDNAVSQIYAELDDSVKVQENTIESEEIVEDKLYKFVPAIREPYDEDFEQETKLSNIADFEPYCKVIEKIVVSKDEDDIFVRVTFDIPENENLDLPDYAKEDYIVFEEDLQPVVEEFKVSETIDVNTEKDVEQTSTALLTALNSEKEAVITYEMLLNISNDEEEKQLLTKILEDEKEHVALLSGLQSSKVAGSVAEDNKEQLDSYAEDIIDTPPME